MVHTRSDIALVVGMVAIFSTNPKEKSYDGDQENHDVSKRH